MRWTAATVLLLLLAPAVTGQDDPLPLPPDDWPAPPDDGPAPPPPPERGPADAPVGPAGTLLVQPAAEGPRVARVSVDVEYVPLREVMAHLSRTVGVPLAVDPRVNESVTLRLRDLPWREVVHLIARMSRCQQEPLPGGGVLLTQPPTVSLSVLDADLRGVLETISRVAGHPVIPLPDVEGKVTLELQEVPWRRALDLVADAAGLRVTERPGVVLISRRPLPLPVASPWRPTDDGPRLDVTAANADLAELLDEVGRRAGHNVLVTPGVNTAVSLELRGAPWQVVVALAAGAAGCEVEERPGGILLVARPARFVVRARGAPAGLLLTLLAAAAGKNVVAGPHVDERVSVELPGVGLADAVRLLAVGQGWTLEERPDDALLVRAEPRPALPLPVTPFDAEIDRLVDDAARLARARRLPELDAALAVLRERVAREVAPPAAAPSPASPAAADPRELERELERLLGDLLRLAERREVEAMIERFSAFRALLARAGPAGAATARRALERWAPRMRDLGEVQTSLWLQVDLQVGGDALDAMEEAIRRADWAAVRESAARLEGVIERMVGEEREVFHRNAEALHLRGRTLQERAARLEMVETRYGTLTRVTATLVDRGDARASRAIVGEQLVRDGDELVDPRTGEAVEGLRVVEISPAGVRLRFEGTEFFRALGSPR